MGISDINGLKIKGGKFSKAVTFEFWPGENRICMLYGRNRSGKSTIARAINNIAGKYTCDCIKNPEFKYSTELLPTEVDMDCIHVYNEDFCNDAAVFSDDKLRAIVMLGKQPKLQNELQIENEALSVKKAEIATAQKDLESYKNKEKILHDTMMDFMNNENRSWALRRKAITNDSSIKKATKKDLDRIFSLPEPSRKYTEIEAEYKQTLRFYNELLQHCEPHTDFMLPEAFSVPCAEKHLIELLKNPPLQPVLSKREQSLIALTEEIYAPKDFDAMAKNFQSTETDFCPYCLRTFSKEEKSALGESINKVLNNKVKLYKQDLNACRPKIPNDIDLAFSLGLIDDELRAACDTYFKAYKRAALQYNAWIDKQIENPYYLQIDVRELQLEGFYNDYCSAAKEINSLIKQCDALIQADGGINCTEIERSLHSLNDLLAQQDIMYHQKEYFDFKDKTTSQEALLEKLQQQASETEEKIIDLKGQLKNVWIPYREINKWLRYIFYSQDAVQLKKGDGCYKITSNKKSVKMSDLSRGEKNAITLCYYFVSYKNGENNEQSKSRLFVIDDPVSSFDLDNRVGILSFLRTKIIELSNPASKNKILYLSHDLSSFVELNQSLKGTVADNHRKVYKLMGTDLVHVDEKKLNDDFNEYTELLINTYKYASGKNPEIELYIGNTMRRIMEAYGTFIFKKGLWCVKSSDEFWQDIKDNDLSEHLKYFMFRTLLNEGSHLGDRAKAAQEMNFSKTISTDEKIRTAKAVICFLYGLDKTHLKCHLTHDAQNPIERGKPWDWRILQWINEIKSIEIGAEFSPNKIA